MKFQSEDNLYRNKKFQKCFDILDKVPYGDIFLYSQQITLGKVSCINQIEEGKKQKPLNKKIIGTNATPIKKVKLL